MTRASTGPHRGPEPVPDLAALSHANRVEVRTNLAAPLNEIDDPPTLVRIHRAVTAITGEWTKPPGGVPVAPVRLEFYRGDDLLAAIGVAPQVVTLHQHGDFWSQPSTAERRAELLALVGVAS